LHEQQALEWVRTCHGHCPHFHDPVRCGQCTGSNRHLIPHTHNRQCPSHEVALRRVHYLGSNLADGFPMARLYCLMLHVHVHVHVRIFPRVLGFVYHPRSGAIDAESSSGLKGISRLLSQFGRA
jgi:hypothetical protein